MTKNANEEASYLGIGVWPTSSKDVMRQWSENELRLLMAEMIKDYHKAQSQQRHEWTMSRG